MIKIEHIETFGFETAIRGMRNPYNSWEKSDSRWTHDYEPGTEKYIVGENDLSLMKRLFKGGTEHRKYLRMIFVSLDITAPLYWWKEFDTYKVGTVANSCSTMHTIAAKEFERSDFSTEHLIPRMLDVLDVTIANLNACRGNYLECKDKKWWWQLIQLLPSSYNQKRTVTMNYENVYTILRQRRGHKLDEWNELCAVLSQLPYVKEIADEKGN